MNGSHRIPHWLLYHARTSPETIALEYQDYTWTYRQLASEVIHLAKYFSSRGIEHGTRVAVVSKNHPLQVKVLHALILLGAVVVPVNHRLTPQEMEWHIDNAGCRYLCLQDASRELISDGVLPGEIITLSTCEKASKSPGGSVPDLRGFKPDDICGIFYTSGTTGKPRGAILTYSNFFMSAMASAMNLGISGADKWLTCLPLDHMGGFSILMRSVIYGTTMVLEQGFDQTRVRKQLRENSITLLSLVPTMLHRMLQYDTAGWHTLRALLIGGGPAPAALIKEALERELPVLRTYGMTETCSQVATMPLSESSPPVESSGKVLPFTTLQVVHADGTSCRPGERGEIVIRGPTVMEGYWRSPLVTNRTIVQGWLHTGDLGELDAEHFLYVVARRDDLIITGGENVYPEEVEQVLKSHPGIKDAGVVGIADSQWSQVVSAVVVLEPESDLDETALRTLRFDSLASFKHPKHYVIVKSLPKTSLGKLERKKLRAIIEHRLAGEKG